MGTLMTTKRDTQTQGRRSGAGASTAACARKGAPPRPRKRTGKSPAARQGARATADTTQAGGILAFTRSHKRLVRVLAVLVVTAVLIAVGVRGATYQAFDAKYADCEKWRDTAALACSDCELGQQWTNAVLAAMVVESSGDLDVDSVLGVKNDIMQAAEGAWGWIVIDGWPERNLEAETPQASIYAGVLEFKQNLELWNEYLGGIEPADAEKIQLVIQGYNFGADGWFQWCENEGIRAYSVEAAKKYSDEKMPADAKGTPTHAAKWLDAYKRIQQDEAGR